MTLDEAYKRWREKQEQLQPYPTIDLYDAWLGRVGRSTVQKYLAELVKEGRAVRERVGRQYRYRII